MELAVCSPGEGGPVGVLGGVEGGAKLLVPLCEGPRGRVGHTEEVEVGEKTEVNVSATPGLDGHTRIKGRKETHASLELLGERQPLRDDRTLSGRSRLGSRVGRRTDELVRQTVQVGREGFCRAADVVLVVCGQAAESSSDEDQRVGWRGRRKERTRRRARLRSRT